MFQQLPSAKNNRLMHFENLNRYQREGQPAEWMLGKFWQISAALYVEFLELLPPIYCRGGFRLSEHLTGDISATYLEVGGTYWCGFTDLTKIRPENLINSI